MRYIAMAWPGMRRSRLPSPSWSWCQEFTGFFTPGITVIFLLGLFWKRANEAGAIAAAAGSVLLSYAFKTWLPQLPFMDRMGWVFLITLALAVLVSLVTRARAEANRIDTRVEYATSAGFNLAALAVLGILAALYATWW